MDKARLHHRRARLVLLWPMAAVAVVALAALAVGNRPGAPSTLEERTEAVGRTIRCPACGNLSVADATSSLAVQMRSSIQAQLARGRTPDQIRSAFVRRYGSWILLEPPGRGFGLAAWVAPLAALAVGVVVLVSVARRSRHGSLR